MWSYYGSKAKLAGVYPSPKYDLIIEPFAGAAWYSVVHRHNNVWLNEKYDVIYGIWEWLLTTATPDDILLHTDFFLGQNIKDIGVPKPHKDLIGFCINRGSSAPRNMVQQWSCQSAKRPGWASTTAYRLKNISELLGDIKHWRVTFGDYTELPDIEATWFIDPPYQFGGNRYAVNNINYKELAEWCRSRRGQVIVCENTKADWLPFVPIAEITGQRKKTTECIWIK